MQIMALAIFGLIYFIVFIVVHLLLRQKGCLLKGVVSFVGTVGVICLLIYGYSPKSIEYSSPELTPLWKAIGEVERQSMGFTPVSKDSKIRIERAKGRDYDIMLHIYHDTTRTIAFKRKAEGVYWIGEQQIFRGPKKYSTPDGTFNEDICITYHSEKYSDSTPTSSLTIRYSGEDPRLQSRHNLSLSDIQPILREWKYQVQQSPAGDS